MINKDFKKELLAIVEKLRKDAANRDMSICIDISPYDWSKPEVMIFLNDELVKEAVFKRVYEKTTNGTKIIINQMIESEDNNE